ncbi:hypothetical protein K492DRAFT_168869 [Lichtheimia hyalospora FSU 10163]|nr:hypothetical protein K492DRAFT_168869 [Lichtheimia hyalospora FSU 10163]
MAEIPHKVVSPTFEKQALAILGTKNELDAPDFDPVDYVNRFFPNEHSIGSIDTVLSKIHDKIRVTKVEIERHTTTQSESEHQAAQELERAKGAIKTLFQNIQDIKCKASHSEAMVQEITQDVKSLDYAKRHLTHSVTALKRLQMLVTAIDQLESMSQNNQLEGSAQLLQAVVQLMQHFKSYKSVPQIALLSDRITGLQTSLERKILTTFEQGFQSDGSISIPSNTLQDACKVASALGENTKEKVINIYVDSQLKPYRQIFGINEEVSQLDNISRRYAWLKRLLKSCDENHAEIFPRSWCITGRLCEQFCDLTRTDLGRVLGNTQPLDVKELLKALQLTIEFEGQLSKRYEKMNKYENLDKQMSFEKRISSCFIPYLDVYIDAQDRTLNQMINSYVESDRRTEDESNVMVLPSSTDLFYFYRETLVQCARFSTGEAFWKLSQLFSKHLRSYCKTVLIDGVTRDRNTSTDGLQLISLALNTADYCCMTTSQLEDKLKETIDDEFRDKVDLQDSRESFMGAVSSCIDSAVQVLQRSCDNHLQQMIKLSWSSLDTVGDQSEYVTFILDTIKESATTVGHTIANKRYFRTFCDRFVDSFLLNFLVHIFRCKPVSEIGAEQLLLDTHAIKTLLMELPLTASDAATTVPTSYGKLVSKGVSRIETVLKTIMTPLDPIEGFVENYIFLTGDKHIGNYTRLLDLKGIKKSEQGPLIDAFQRRVASCRNELTENPNLLPNADLVTQNGSNIPGAFTLSTIASSASNFNQTALPPFVRSSQAISGNTPPASPNVDGNGSGARTAGRLNENFRKLVMTGMAFRKDLQERRDQQKQ